MWLRQFNSYSCWKNLREMEKWLQNKKKIWIKNMIDWKICQEIEFDTSILIMNFSSNGTHGQQVRHMGIFPINKKIKQGQIYDDAPDIKCNKFSRRFQKRNILSFPFVLSATWTLLWLPCYFWFGGTQRHCLLPLPSNGNNTRDTFLWFCLESIWVY